MEKDPQMVCELQLLMRSHDLIVALASLLKSDELGRFLDLIEGHDKFEGFLRDASEDYLRSKQPRERTFSIKLKSRNLRRISNILPEYLVDVSLSVPFNCSLRAMGINGQNVTLPDGRSILVDEFFKHFSYFRVKLPLAILSRYPGADPIIVKGDCEYATVFGSIRLNTDTMLNQEITICISDGTSGMTSQTKVYNLTRTRNAFSVVLGTRTVSIATHGLATNLQIGVIAGHVVPGNGEVHH